LELEQRKLIERQILTIGNPEELRIVLDRAAAKNITRERAKLPQQDFMIPVRKVDEINKYLKRGYLIKRELSNKRVRPRTADWPVTNLGDGIEYIYVKPTSHCMSPDLRYGRK
jgi:hypothetical protein